MSDLNKILLGAFFTLVGGFLAGYVNYYLQFNRNRSIEQKAQLRILYNLIKETIDYTQHQINAFELFNTELAQQPTVIPLISVPAHNSSKDLLDRIIMDEYYTSYACIMKNAIDSEKKFYEAKRHTIFIHNQIQELIRLITDSALRDNERRKQYIQKYKNLHPFINNLFVINAAEMSDVLKTISQQTKIFSQKMTEENNGSGKIDEIHSLFVSPILEVALLVKNQHIEGFSMDLAEMVSLHNEIIFQNKGVMDDILQGIPTLKKALNGLENVKTFLSDNQIKSFFFKG